MTLKMGAFYSLSVVQNASLTEVVSVTGFYQWFAESITGFAHKPLQGETMKIRGGSCRFLVCGQFLYLHVLWCFLLLLYLFVRRTHGPQPRLRPAWSIALPTIFLSTERMLRNLMKLESSSRIPWQLKLLNPIHFDFILTLGYVCAGWCHKNTKVQPGLRDFNSLNIKEWLTTFDHQTTSNNNMKQGIWNDWNNMKQHNAVAALCCS